MILGSDSDHDASEDPFKAFKSNTDEVKFSISIARCFKIVKKKEGKI